jgi:ribulose-5-phosphate 4-epimerase/fuculose-1-phosphate aldolase
MAAEGVIQFTYDLITGGSPSRVEVEELTRWRAELFSRDSIGGDLSRYGACYGNVSIRTSPDGAPSGQRGFIVSCTQTGDVQTPDRDCYCRVQSYSHRANHVVAIGVCAPSSEALTHGAMYDASDHIRAIVHGHDAILWQWMQASGAPGTPSDVDYGTVEMANAARRVVQECASNQWVYPGVLSMNGHKDGVIAWGSTPRQATTRYVAAWNASRTYR